MGTAVSSKSIRECHAQHNQYRLYQNLYQKKHSIIKSDIWNMEDEMKQRIGKFQIKCVITYNYTDRLLRMRNPVVKTNFILAFQQWLDSSNLVDLLMLFWCYFFVLSFLEKAWKNNMKMQEGNWELRITQLASLTTHKEKPQTSFSTPIGFQEKMLQNVRIMYVK